MRRCGLIQESARSVAALGWAWIPAALNADPNSLAVMLGASIPARRDGCKVVDLRPYSRSEAPRASMSAVVGHDAQPMHTDAAYFPVPPRYIMFECIEPGEADCLTHVWTFDWNKMLKEQPDILVEPGWIACGGRTAPFYCQVLTTTSNGEKFLRFDPLCMTPPSYLVNPKAVSEELCRYADQLDFSWTKGDILIVDNWLCLHARGSGADRAPSRRLRRWSIGEANGLVV
jgi:hypothetical protein